MHKPSSRGVPVGFFNRKEPIMADETTQTAPVAGVQENATQTQPTKLYVYYYSNPDGATKDERCHAIFTEAPFNVVPWRMHKEAPAESMADPVWDDKLNSGLGAWKENSGTAQAQILAEAQAKIDALDKSKQQLDETVKSLQAGQQAGTAQSLALTKSIKALTDGQADQNKVLQSMQALMLQMASQKQATPTAPTQPTIETTNQATDKQENGGNN